MKNVKENIMRFVFILAACVSIAAVALICIFLFANGIPAIAKIGPLKFLGGTTWNPNQEIFGIFPMIIGSIYATAIAIIVGVPIGLLTSVFLARFCPEKLYKVLKPAVSLLAGIPSIVYGFFGLVVMVPIMQNLTGVSGKNVLTAGILLGFMIQPSLKFLKHRFGQSRTAIMKARWHWVQRMNEAFILRCCQQQSPALWQVSFWALVVRLGKPWRSL